MGASRILDGRSLRIGSAAANDLSLTHPSVSRFHCAIDRTPRGLFLRDLGSTNGTQVGGFLVQSAYLMTEVPIQIGASTLRVATAAGAPSSSSSSSSPSSPSPAVERHDYDARLLGSSPVMQQLLAQLAAAAQTTRAIFLNGETGTGKTLLAEIIHDMSPRRHQPFIRVDCAALPMDSLEDVLLGVEPGHPALPAGRMGAFEAVGGGTIFLDEVAALPPIVQRRLARVLEDRAVTRIGGATPVAVDPLIIAASNRDLANAVSGGGFRADLFRQLTERRVRVPPLRERLNDIPSLLNQYARRIDPQVSPRFLRELTTRLSAQKHWPGNIRQLRNVVEKSVCARTVAISAGPSVDDDDVFTVADVHQRVGGGTSFHDAKEQALLQWEREYLFSLIRHAAGSVARAARVAQLDPTHLQDLLRRHRIAS
jgi:DNA-binding NtrC family response regulator